MYYRSIQKIFRSSQLALRSAWWLALAANEICECGRAMEPVHIHVIAWPPPAPHMLDTHSGSPPFRIQSPMVVRVKISVYVGLEETPRANKVAVSWHAQSILEISQGGTGCRHCSSCLIIYAHLCAQLQAFVKKCKGLRKRSLCEHLQQAFQASMLFTFMAAKADKRFDILTLKQLLLPLFSISH